MSPQPDPPEARTMSATTPDRGLASPESRRRPGNRPANAQRMLLDRTTGVAPGSSADGTRRVPDPQPPPMPDTQPQCDTPTETWWESLQRAQRARAGRLRSLWQMSAAERVAAMRRGDLSHEQLAAWSARYPGQIPTVHGEFEWIVAKLPEVCE